MKKNLPQIISDLKNGKGVFIGSPLFIRDDGSVFDVNEREHLPASALGKAAYDEFEGMAAPSEVDADISAHDANASAHSTQISGAISTHNSDAEAHSILARKTETMRLLISRTIGAGENVSAITWTQDDAGNALALKDIDIRIGVPSNSVSVGSSANIYARFNGVASSGQYVQSSALANALYASIFRSTFGLGILSLKENCGYLSGYTSFSNYDGTTVGNGTIASGTVFAVSSVTKVYLFISGLTYIPEGTAIEIWGRTA